MIRLLISLNLVAGAAVAQEVMTDAFGIVPLERLDDRDDWAGLRQRSDGQSILREAGPADAAILFVGPKSIVAGLEPGHAVAIGLDVHGNMLDGVDTQFALGFGDAINANTRSGIADVLFTPPPKSGYFLAGASVDGVQSSRADYRVTAHLATVKPQFAGESASILPETFATIATEQLSDVYGNLVDDGVGLSVFLTDAHGAMTLLPSVVRDAAAQSTLLSRDISGPVSGELALSGANASGLYMEIAPMVLEDAGAFLIWAEPSINATRMRLGPLQTSNGFLVPDGTAGTIEVGAVNAGQITAEGWVLDGYMSFTLAVDPETAPFEISLSITGNTEMRTVDISMPPENAKIRGAE